MSLKKNTPIRSVGAAAILLIIGCLANIGPDAQTNGTDGGGGAGGGGGGGTHNSDAAVDDLSKPYGFDARPSNTTCLAAARPVSNTGVTTAPAFPSLSFTNPLFLVHAPNETNRLFVVEQGGVVKWFNNDNTATTTTTFINLTSRVTSGGERGLLGMAFHPNFATNGQVFLSYTRTNGGLQSVISRFTSSDNGQTLDPNSEQIILTVDQPYDNHNGGGINFGPDGYLYIGFGDGGSGGDPQNNAQNLNSLLGKMLRIDVDGAAPYAIPSDNPFANGGGRPEIFAWGLRNPWRWSFDKGTGELWLGDVGQNQIEEMDKIVLGGNYGWRIREGAQCYNAASCNTTGLIEPITTYDHSQGQSITGGYVYRGTAIPSLIGKPVYADYASGRIWAISTDPITGQVLPLDQQLLVDSNFSISSFGQAPDGELFIVNYFQGNIQKLVPAGAPVVDTFPQKLSQTGCVDPSDPKKVASGVIPYDVNAPLWSDGAEKERYFAIPDGTQIEMNADGDWDFPDGTVLMKTFYIGGKRVETRLFMRHSDSSWAGYSYEWDDAETDATLLPSSKTRQVGTQTWYYPSRSECLACHSAAAGRSLGLENGQLNRDFLYPTARTRNQLSTLSGLGFFSAALPATAGRFADYGGADAIEDRAKAYLHGNCSMCHRPNGTGGGSIDFRYSTALAQMNICNANPTEGDLGVANAKRLVPGDPASSIISLRIHALNANRMPPLASRVVDPNGSALIDQWITSLNACP
jgi:uncharacterized repeat protein (TIGR03806 family)